MQSADGHWISPVFQQSPHPGCHPALSCHMVPSTQGQFLSLSFMMLTPEKHWVVKICRLSLSLGLSLFFLWLDRGFVFFTRIQQKRCALATVPFHGVQDVSLLGNLKLDHLTQVLGFLQCKVTIFPFVTNTYLVGRHFETTQTSCFSSYFLPTNFSNRGWGLPTVITVEFSWWSFSTSFIPSTFINWISPGRNRVISSSPFTDLFNYLFYSMGYNPFPLLFNCSDCARFGHWELSWLLGPFTIHCLLKFFSSF